MSLNRAIADVKEELGENLSTETNKPTATYDCLLTAMCPSNFCVCFALFCLSVLVFFFNLIPSNPSL